MRYTTILDMTEDRALYRNQATRLVYLHLVLRSGYHDDDRDIARISIRTIAADAGLTVAAVRHALSKLMGAEYISRQSDGSWRVRKWVPTVVPTSRRQVKTTQHDLEAARDREERRLERERKAEEEHTTYDSRLEYMRQAYERDPHSLAGKAYAKYLAGQEKK